LGKNKKSVVDGFEYLINKAEITAVVAPPDPADSKQNLLLKAQQYGVTCMSDQELYSCIKNPNKTELSNVIKEVDLVLSFLFWKRIKQPLIELPKIGCLNFHPAPLPEFRGVSPYTFGIYENLSYWGVSVHFVDPEFDTGDIIKVEKFDINLTKETAFSLEQKSQEYLLKIFKETIEIALSGRPLPRKKQKEGRCFTKEDFEKLRIISSSDTYEEIERKIRAFWYPPYPGAALKFKDKEFTIIDQNILNKIGSQYHQ